MPANTLDIQLSMRGDVKLTAVQKEGGGARDLAAFKNMILDNGFAMLLSPQPGSFRVNPFHTFRVGSGSTAVLPEQNSLVSEMAQTTTAVSDQLTFSSSPPYWIRRSVTKRFAEGVAQGNIAEFGVGPGGTGMGPFTNQLFARALVLDMNGDPTTVTVEPTEFLDATYSITVYVSTTDAISTLNLNGVSHTVTLRPAGLGSSAAMDNSFFLNGSLLERGYAANGPFTFVSNAALPPVTGSYSGTQTVTTNVVQPYVPLSMAGSVETTFAINVGNVAGGIRLCGYRLQNFLAYNIGFDPPIPKTSSQSFRFMFRLTLARRDVT